MGFSLSLSLSLRVGKKVKAVLRKAGGKVMTAGNVISMASGSIE